MNESAFRALRVTLPRGSGVTRKLRLVRYFSSAIAADPCRGAPYARLRLATVLAAVLVVDLAAVLAAVLAGPREPATTRNAGFPRVGASSPAPDLPAAAPLPRLCFSSAA